MSYNTIQIAKLADAMGIEIGRATRKITIDVLRRVIERSPVDTGRFRASWRVSEGEPDFSVERPGAFGLPNPTIPRITGTETVIISNNLPYAEALEHGHSRQAPLGIVGITVAEVEATTRQYLPDEIG